MRADHRLVMAIIKIRKPKYKVRTGAKKHKLAGVNNKDSGRNENMQKKVQISLVPFL